MRCAGRRLPVRAIEMADLKLGMRMDGLDQVRRGLGALSQKAPLVAAKALNDVAFAGQAAMRQALRSAFDRPTTWIANSPKVATATSSRLQATVAPTAGRADRLPTTGGKVGVDPQHVLQAQAFGGRRADKRSEVRLRRIGVLPAGYQIVIPATPFPGSEDGHGNLRGPFVVQVMSYIQAFGDDGYRANMSERRKRVLHTRGGASLKGGGPYLGRRYFVSYGRLRGGTRTTARGDVDQRTGHLAPGIWAVVGRTGADVRPVMLFVKRGNYKPRLSVERLLQGMNVPELLDRRMRFRTYEALEAAGLR